MSHAIYSFLIKVEEFDELLAEMSQSEAITEITTAATEVFYSYLEASGDDNNWSDPLKIVLKDGRTFVLDESLSNELSAHERLSLLTPDASRWNQAIRFALDCCVLDMDALKTNAMFPDEDAIAALDAMSDSEVLAALHREMPARIAGLYRDLGPPDPDNHDTFEGYKRRKVVMQYECLRSARIPPFSTQILSPYDYRAFDLAYGPALEPNAILTADIHT